jgi:uncharacterized Rossmann fold enzyme
MSANISNFEENEQIKRKKLAIGKKLLFLQHRNHST